MDYKDTFLTLMQLITYIVHKAQEISSSNILYILLVIQLNFPRFSYHLKKYIPHPYSIFNIIDLINWQSFKNPT